VHANVLVPLFVCSTHACNIDSPDSGGANDSPGSGRSRTGSPAAPILMPDPGPSRPELLRQISGVVANKPSSSRRRASLRKMTNLASAALHAQLTESPSSRPSPGEESSDDDVDVQVIVSRESCLSTIDSVGTSPGGTTEDLDEHLQSPRVTRARAVEIGKAAGREYATSLPSDAPSTTATNEHFDAGKVAGVKYAKLRAERAAGSIASAAS